MSKERNIEFLKKLIEEQNEQEQTMSLLKKEIKELRVQNGEEKFWLDSWFQRAEKSEAKVIEQEKELGYYRWYEQHIEQHFPDTFYDMRNGNEYRTRVGCRAQYEKEMELKKTPLL